MRGRKDLQTLPTPLKPVYRFPPIPTSTFYDEPKYLKSRFQTAHTRRSRCHGNQWAGPREPRELSRRRLKVHLGLLDPLDTSASESPLSLQYLEGVFLATAEE